MRFKINLEKVEEVKKSLSGAKTTYLSWQNVNAVCGVIEDIKPSKFNDKQNYAVIRVSKIDADDETVSRLESTEMLGSVPLPKSLEGLEVGADVLLINEGMKKSKNGINFRLVTPIPTEVAREQGLV